MYIERVCMWNVFKTTSSSDYGNFFFRVMHVGQQASGKRLTTVGHEPRFEILVNLHISINKDFHDYFFITTKSGCYT